jgi:hypothetical protein
MTTTTLFISVLLGAIGAAYLLYARKQRAGVPMVCGLGLLVMPYLAHNVWVLALLGAVLVLAPWFWRR